MEAINFLFCGGLNMQGPGGCSALIVEVTHGNGDGGNKGHSYHNQI
jgi:hypothetical protein